MNSQLNQVIYIMRGLSGMGKTTKARELAGTRGDIVSADHYFTKAGEYQFDPSKLAEAHGDCFRRAMHYLDARDSQCIVIDNTNISNIEVAPYVLLAQAYGWKHKIIALYTESASIVVECARRNVHGVPTETVLDAYDRYLREIAATPPWWNQDILTPNVELDYAR